MIQLHLGAWTQDHTAENILSRRRRNQCYLLCIWLPPPLVPGQVHLGCPGSAAIISLSVSTFCITELQTGSDKLLCPVAHPYPLSSPLHDLIYPKALSLTSRQ